MLSKEPECVSMHTFAHPRVRACEHVCVMHILHRCMCALYSHVCCMCARTYAYM